MMETTASQQPPLLLIHRIPQIKASFFPFLQSGRYRILDALDESDLSFPTLSKSARVMLCLGPSKVTAETLDRYPSLECIVGSSAGYDHFDLAECRRRGIRVTTGGDSFSDDVADFAVGLLIDVLRRVSVSDRFVRAGSWPKKGEFPVGSKVGGKRVGIVGLGSIGSRISRRLEAFGCSIAYTSKNIKPNIPFRFYENINHLASNSDILIVCCALTQETRHIVDKNVMLALGEDGIIINVGRGPLIDEKELVRLLVSGEIGGAGLDVYEDEPNVPRELFGLDNVVLSSHMSFATPEGIAQLHALVATNVESFFLNKALQAEIQLQ
nr:glyoxylate/hydroxypyruvate reductase HPR3-like [Ipomoea batatas]